MKNLNRANKTYLLLAAATLISIIHTYHPVTLSPNDSGDRMNFMFVILFSAYFARAGYSFGRVGIGVAFIFAATINLLIGLGYGLTMNAENFIELTFWILALGVIGSALLLWKEIRVFEENKTFTKNLATPQI